MSRPKVALALIENSIDENNPEKDEYAIYIDGALKGTVLSGDVYNALSILDESKIIDLDTTTIEFNTKGELPEEVDYTWKKNEPQDANTQADGTANSEVTEELAEGTVDLEVAALNELFEDVAEIATEPVVAGAFEPENEPSSYAMTAEEIVQDEPAKPAIEVEIKAEVKTDVKEAIEAYENWQNIELVPTEAPGQFGWDERRAGKQDEPKAETQPENTATGEATPTPETQAQSSEVDLGLQANPEVQDELGAEATAEDNAPSADPVKEPAAEAATEEIDLTKVDTEPYHPIDTKKVVGLMKAVMRLSYAERHVFFSELEQSTIKEAENCKATNYLVSSELKRAANVMEWLKIDFQQAQRHIDRPLPTQFKITDDQASLNVCSHLPEPAQATPEEAKQAHVEATPAPEAQPAEAPVAQ